MLPAGSGSHIIDDTVKYVKFDRSGLTQLVNNKNPAVGYKFR